MASFVEFSLSLFPGIIKERARENVWDLQPAVNSQRLSHSVVSKPFAVDSNHLRNSKLSAMMNDVQFIIVASFSYSFSLSLRPSWSMKNKYFILIICSFVTCSCLCSLYLCYFVGRWIRRCFPYLIKRGCLKWWQKRLWMPAIVSSLLFSVLSFILCCRLSFPFRNVFLSLFLVCRLSCLQHVHG